MPNGIFEGGMLPPVVVSANGDFNDDDLFGPNFKKLNRMDDIFDQYDSGIGSGGSSNLIVSPPVVTIGNGTPRDDNILYTPIKSGDALIDEIEAKRVADINEGRARQGLPPLTNKTANETFTDPDGKATSIAAGIAADTVKELDRISEQQDAAAAMAARTAARTNAATGNSGIPLIVPIPGIDPVTGLAITAAGLIFSGGNVAKLDPTNPIQSVVNAGQGMIKTGSNAVDVITGQKDISDIWGSGSTGGSGTGSGAGAGSGAGSGAGGNAGTGSIVGGQNEVIGLDPAGMGAIGVLGTGGSSGSAQPPVGGGNVSVTPGALGGSVGNQTVGGSTVPAVVPTSTNQNVNNSSASGIFGTGSYGTEVKNPVITGPLTAGPVQQPANTNVRIPGIGGDITTKSSTPAGSVSINQTTSTGTGTGVIGTGTGSTNSTGTTSTTTGIVGTGGGETPQTTSSTIITGTGTGTGTGTSTSVSTTPIVNPTFSFTSPTNTGLAQRDYAKEFGLTSDVLTGKPGDDLAAYYKQLQAQFTPSSLTTLGREAESQLAADLARYNEAQRGNLSQEDVRTAQQGAREAYAARGQVMGPRAIGAEILGRDALQRQREAEARASVQQSMGNLANAANLQTGNIFSPFASLISQTYSPTNQYAREVYDYNVNAYNAYQAAQQNLAAYKEAAAKGQEAQFLNAFAGFITNNGIQTTASALSKIFNGLLGGGTVVPKGT